ncbi:MAG TPA: hypothetical protein VIA98_05990 [Allosphingosinicella sp.]
MTARFILSLDCEGKWGVADVLTRDYHRQLSDERLREAYHALLALLRNYDVAATFAFVGLFGEDRANVRRLEPELRQLAEQVPHYLSPALEDMTAGSREGWHGDWAVADVLEQGPAHEVALHGVTHVPWGTVDRSFIDAERRLHAQLGPELRAAKTFVYPRNDIAHQAQLRDFGIGGYRLARLRSRAASLATEFSVFTPPDTDPQPLGDPVGIPAGHFVNWRHGPRRLVPRWLSILRGRRMLDRASATGGVVHYWLHPENIASAPDTLDVLRGILAHVARLREAGRCEVLTQLDYCRKLAGAAAGPRAAA